MYYYFDNNYFWDNVFDYNILMKFQGYLIIFFLEYFEESCFKKIFFYLKMKNYQIFLKVDQFSMIRVREEIF